MTERPLRVLIAEDSPTVRARLVEILEAAPGIVVAGEAADGREAIELCAALKPDVMTLDMMLPVMTGLAATEYVMAYHPVPILIVSASVNRGELFRTYEALAAGAVDVLEKPLGGEPAGEWEARLVEAVRMAARIRVITHPRARLAGARRDRGGDAAPPAGDAARGRRVLALGASTGGPGALVAVLRGLPAPVPCPVLAVMHLAEPFAAAFAEWLDGQTAHRVGWARDGEAVAGAAGRVAMAPAGRHLRVQDGRFRLTDEPERHSCRPSVDVLFESVAAGYGPDAAAALLTGMGRDGAAGLLALRRAGGVTIAQDEATSVVWGMPREAVELGAAARVLPLGEIGGALGEFAAARAEARRP